MKTATAQTAVNFRNILFATDFSSAAAHAIPYVKRIAKRYDANLVALHVRPPVINPMTEPAYWPSEETIRQENEEHRDQLLDTFAGIRTTPLIEEGDIQSRLQDAIAKNNTDLVVIGTRGRTGLGKMLLGSVAEEIFRTVTCPVLTVGPHADSSRGADGEIREILLRDRPNFRFARRGGLRRIPRTRISGASDTAPRHRGAQGWRTRFRA